MEHAWFWIFAIILAAAAIISIRQKPYKRPTRSVNLNPAPTLPAEPESAPAPPETAHKATPNVDASPKRAWIPYDEWMAFYSTPEWRALRYATLERYGGRCMLCGASGKNTRLHVDHIRPRSKFPELALDPENLQVLCEPCNMGKGNRYQTDWRHQR